MDERSILKADGTREPFVPEKLRQSLLRAGAAPKTAENIAEHLEREIQDGASTSAIYRHAFDILKRSEKLVASRYSIKRAIQELGPSGFPFEDYLAELFRARGYAVETRVVLRGECVSHELDLLAHRNDTVLGLEAKFHNDLGTKSDVRVALYVQSRFADLKEKLIERAGKSLSEYWLVTNTKFTADAIEYGRCSGLTMVSWNYPAKGNLPDLIEETAIYPVTSLTTLSRSEKHMLIGSGIVLCKDVLQKEEELRGLGLKDSKIKAAVAETKGLCDVSHAVT